MTVQGRREPRRPAPEESGGGTPPLQCTADGEEHVVDADLIELGGILGAQGLADVLDLTQVRVVGEVRLVQRAGGIELDQFLGRVLPRLTDAFLDVGERALVTQVHQQAGHRQVFGEPHGQEDDACEAQAHAAHTRLHGAAGAVQPDALFSAGAEFFQQVCDVLRQGRQTAGADPAGQREVGPQVTQDLDQVGLAAAVEAADPGRLLFLAEVVQVALEDLGEPRLVFALTNEGVQFVAKGLGVFDVVAGDAFVGDLPGPGVFQEQCAVLHGVGPVKRP
jgi:hypothetical protein